MGTHYIVGGIVTAVAIFLIILVLRHNSRRIRGPIASAGAAAAIGEKAVVTERIENIAGCGQAEVNGQCWSACSLLDADVFEEGDVVSVIAAEGVRLICKK